MTTKVAFQNYPVLVIVTLLIASLLAYAYSLYVIER